MKKFLVLSALVLMAFLVVFPIFISASAEGTVPSDDQMYDWGKLLTIPGAIAATLLVVQYFKFPLDKVWKIPTRWLVLVIAFGLMALAKYASGGIAPLDLPLLAMNAFVVALSAMGAYEVFLNKSK